MTTSARRRVTRNLAAARIRAVTAILVLFAANSGCARSSEKVRKAAETLRSWDATLALLAEEAARGAAPPGYAAQLRQVAAEERSRAQARLRQVGGP
jgi:hypothetical protein